MAAEIRNLSPQHVWGYFHDLTQIPRPTGHMDAVTRYILAFGKESGLETLQDKTGNIVIRKPATPGMEHCKTVIIQGHLDMVPQKNAATVHNFETDPIDAYIDGDWVTARDTTLGADNGIGVALALAVLSDNTLKHGPVEALFTVDEEVGMDGAFGLKPGFLKGEILINADSEEEGELFVGCAGGADLNISFQRLSSIDGGSLRNAIPREAVAIITIPGDNVEALWELVADYQDMFRTEYQGIEESVLFVAEPAELPASLIPEEIQDDLINAIEGCQNGVISMLADFPGTVETSTNLASVKKSDQLIEIKILTRSSSESRKEQICSSLESVFALAGAKVEYGSSYGGWQPNIKSEILGVMQRVYEQKFGRTPNVKVMHAGLECGIIQTVYPDMDMISFGPDLQYPHSPDERVSISSVQKVWTFLTETLAAM